MGYYTKFTLTVLEGDSDVIEQLREQCDEAQYALETDGSSCESAKWYDCNDDLRSFSTQYPSYLFLLYEEGEESGDICKKFFRNGKMQECKAIITFEDFNETKLK